MKIMLGYYNDNKRQKPADKLKTNFIISKSEINYPFYFRSNLFKKQYACRDLIIILFWISFHYIPSGK